MKAGDRGPVLTADVAADVEPARQGGVDSARVRCEGADRRLVPARLVVEPLADVARIAARKEREEVDLDGDALRDEHLVGAIWRRPAEREIAEGAATRRRVRDVHG